jgi:hypothetical protein
MKPLGLPSREARRRCQPILPLRNPTVVATVKNGQWLFSRQSISFPINYEGYGFTAYQSSLKMWLLPAYEDFDAASTPVDSKREMAPACWKVRLKGQIVSPYR